MLCSQSFLLEVGIHNCRDSAVVKIQDQTDEKTKNINIGQEDEGA